MRALVLILGTLLVCASSASADVCLKHHIHTDGYYFGGETSPPEDSDYEVWLAGSKMSVVLETRTVVFDLDANLLTFINHDDSTYAETTLPLDWRNLLSDADAARVLMFQTEGTVKDPGEARETRKVGERECVGQEMTTWIPYEGTRYNETDTKMWLSTDMPFDLETYEELKTHNLRLVNLKEELLEELKEARGYPMAEESDRYIRGFSVRSTDEVVEISEKEPAYDVYSAPEGFSKKDKLSLQDLRGR